MGNDPVMNSVSCRHCAETRLHIYHKTPGQVFSSLVLHIENISHILIGCRSTQMSLTGNMCLKKGMWKLKDDFQTEKHALTS